MGFFVWYNKNMKLRTNYPILDESLERKSSISQHKDLLCTLVQGEWCPVVFNLIEGVECGHIKSRPVTLRLTEGLNYTFPVGTCKYVKDKYLLSSQDEIKLKKLPKYFGDGLYESHERKNVFLNVGDKALGVRENKILRVGKDYVRAKKILQAEE